MIILLTTTIPQSPKILQSYMMAEKIPIRFISKPNESYSNSYVVYESYKPHNLHTMRDYFEFIYNQRSVLPNNPYFINQSTDILKMQLSPELKEYYDSSLNTELPEQVDKTKILIFDSNFECGNLDRVCIASLNKYCLFLNSDTNTRGHSQWFYFSVTNTEAGRTVTFNIMNCAKWIPLYKLGMKPLIFSELDFEQNGIEWVSDTFNISYIKNFPSKTSTTSETCTNTTSYTLTFSYNFKYSNDSVYLATSRPYSCTMLQHLLNELKDDLIKQSKATLIIEEGELQKELDDFITNVNYI